MIILKTRLAITTTHVRDVGSQQLRQTSDKHSGKQLAAVYVPTTPNPTSGYLEIVPVDKLVSTDWSIDEAMNFIISGGAVAPDDVPYTQGDSPGIG